MTKIVVPATRKLRTCSKSLNKRTIVTSTGFKNLLICLIYTIANRVRLDSTHSCENDLWPQVNFANALRGSLTQKVEF
jgi:hypothetical protein